MFLRKIGKFLLVFLVSLLAIIMLFLAITIAPVDRTPVEETEAYDQMMDNLGNLSPALNEGAGKFSVGYAKVNLTPSFRTATAGYGNRRGKLITGIRDSIYVRALVFDNGTDRAAIVSADLLIIPPTVTVILNEKLKQIGFSLDNTFLNATHTHNSIGNWGEGATRFIYGKYNDEVVNFIAGKIVEAVQQAAIVLKPATIRAGAIPVPDGVNNRMIRGGGEDSLLRVVEIHRHDSTKLLLMSYSAHSTCLYSKDLELSRDYPGALVDTLENHGYDFAMFMAGAMASHGFGAPMAGGECIEWMSDEISETFLANENNLEPVMDSTIRMVRVPLPLSDPQVKISEDWKVRAWFFRAALGEYPVYLTGLRIGDIVFLGTPCDFSGLFNPRIDSLGARYDLFPIVTSFNGGYIGYLTPRALYDHKHYETQFMNWYAPGTGEYVQVSLMEIMEALK